MAVGNHPYCEGCGKQTWNETIRARSTAKVNEEKRKVMQTKVNFPRIFIKFSFPL